MARDYANRFCRSVAWRRCRAACVATVSDGLCESDNIDDPEVTLVFNNLCLLCDSCHMLAHGRGVPIRSSISLDERGRVVATGKRASLPLWGFDRRPKRP